MTDIIARLELDIEGIEQDSETYKRALAGAEAYVMKFIRNQQKMNEAVQRAGVAVAGGSRDFERIRRAIDPVYAATQRYEQSVIKLRRAYADGHVAMQDRIRYEAVLRQRLDQTRRAIDAQAQAAQRSQGIIARFTRSDVGAGLVAGIGVYSVADFARRILVAADTFKQLRGQLRLVVDDQERLVATETALFDAAQRTRASYEATVGLYASLSRSTKALGVDQSDLLAVTEAINKALVISNAPAASAEAALVQLGQAFASGALRGDELNSIMEQTPRVAQAVAAGMGVTIGQLRALGAEGKLTGAQVFKALHGQAAALDAEFSMMPVTIGQAFVQLGNSFMSAAGGLDSATGATAALAEAVSFLARNLDLVAEAALIAAGAFALWKLGAWVAGIGGVTSALIEARKAVYGLAAAVARNPLMLVLTALTVGAVYLIDKFQDMKSADEIAAAAAKKHADERERLNKLISIGAKEAQAATSEYIKQVQQEERGARAAAAAAEAELNRRRAATGKMPTWSAGGEAFSISLAQDQYALSKAVDAVTAAQEKHNEALINLGLGYIMQMKLVPEYRAAIGRLEMGLLDLRLAWGDAKRAFHESDNLFAGIISQFDTFIAKAKEVAGLEPILKSSYDPGAAASSSPDLAKGKGVPGRRMDAPESPEQAAKRALEAERVAQQAAQAAGSLLNSVAGLNRSLDALNWSDYEKAIHSYDAEIANLTVSMAKAKPGTDAYRAAQDAIKRAQAAATGAANDAVRALGVEMADRKLAADLALAQAQGNDAVVISLERERVMREAATLAAQDYVRAGAEAIGMTQEQYVAQQRAAAGAQYDAVKLAETYRDTQREILEISKDISRDVSETIYDGLTDPDGATKVVDWFKSLFKRIAVQALSANVILPITTAVVGSAPGLFGVGGSGSVGQAAKGAAAGGGSITDFLGLGNMFSGSSGMLDSANAWLFGTPANVGTLAKSGASTAGGSAGLFGTFGEIGLGSILGSAGAGFGISQMIAGMAPGNKLASAGGGAVGGAITGLLITGFNPIGAIVGGVAGLIGGLMNDKPSNMEGVNTIVDLSSNSAGVDQGQTGKKYSAENWAAARAASDAVRDAAQTAFGKYADLSAAGVSFGVGSRDGSRSYILQNGQIQQEFRAASDEAGMKSLIGQSIAAIGRQYAEKLPIEMQKALQKIDFSKDIDEALRLLDFASSYQDTVKALRDGYGLEDQARKAARDSIEQQIDALDQFRKDAAFLDLTDAGAAVREFALTLVGLKESKAAVSETEAALSALDESFKVFRENLGTLGLTLDEVNAGYTASLNKLRDDFNDALDRSINEGLGAGYLNTIEDLLKAQAQRIKDATALGADMGRVYKLNALEIRSILKDLTADQLAAINAVAGAAESLAVQLEITFRSITSAIDEQIIASNSAADAARNSAKAYRDAQKSMTDAIRELRGGDLSTLNPLAKLNEARTAFTTASVAAKGGDLTALANLPGLANALLEASRGYNASSTAYANDFSMVEQALKAAGVSSGSLASAAEYQANLLDIQTRVLESIRDNLTNEAGVNETLLREQISALGAIRGLIAASNELTIGQTNATTARLIAAEKAMQAVQMQIAGGIKVTDAATINSALAAVQQGIVGNESAEAKSLRASVAALQSVTQTGLLAVVTAAPTKDALAAAQAAITSTDVKTSNALGGIITALQASTNQGLSVVASAAPIRDALAAASTKITGVDTVESKATRSVIEALTAATNTGLTATARADAVTKALATAQTTIAGTDTANTKALQSLISALNTATTAGLAAETAATKIVQDRVLAAQTAITGNNSAESKAMGSILNGLSALTKTGLTDVAKADAIKAAISQAASYTAGVDTAESRAIKGVIESLSAITNTGLSATAKADAVTKALATAQGAITGVNTTNSTAIKAAVDAVRAITGTGLTATADATKAVKAALATAQSAIASTDAAGSAALSGLIKSLQKATSDGLISVAEGKEIRAALSAVSSSITGVDTAESKATRAVIEALTAATNTGLTATARADAVTKALATAQTAITGTTSASGQAITSIISALRGITAAGFDDVEAAGPIRAALAAVQSGLAAVMGTTTQAVNATTGQIVNIGKLTDAQIKAILAGNSLTSAGTDAVKNQTGEIISGNATTDVLAQLTKHNATISQQIKDVIAGGNAQQASLVAAVVGGNEKVAQLLSKFLQLTQQQQEAAAAQAEAARRAAIVSAAQSAYSSQVSTAGANAAAAAQNTLGTSIGQAQQDYYGRHVAITAQGAGEIIKTEKINTSNGVEQNIPRATALAKMLGNLGAQVQSIVGGTLPEYTVHVSDHNVGDAGTDKALWLLMNGKRVGYAGVNDYNEMARLYLDGLDKYMTGLTSQYKKLLAKTDWSNISAGMKKLAEDVYKLANPYQAPQFATGGAFYGNGIYDRPTAFNMGVMGENGPEAVMPLANVGGRLGVRVAGGANDNGDAKAVVAELREQNRILRQLLAETAKGDEKTRDALVQRLDTANEISAKSASDAKRARAK